MASPDPVQLDQLPMPTRPPAGVQLNNWWRPGPGLPPERHDARLPVDDDLNVVGRLFVCVGGGSCEEHFWLFPPYPPAEEMKPKYCPHHGGSLRETPILPTDDNPVETVRRTARERARAVLDNQKQRAAEAAQDRANRLRVAVRMHLDQANADYRGHRFTASLAAGAFTGNILLVNLDQPLATASLGAAVAMGGGVIAYAVVYVMERRQILASGGMMLGRAARKARVQARRALMAAWAAGGWLILASATGLDPRSPLTALVLLFGFLLIWATGGEHWAEISARRDSQREASRLAQEAAEAARRAQMEADRLRAEAEREAVERVEVVERPPTPEEMGEAMRDWWDEAARSEFAATAFPQMGHTRIVPAKTKPVIVPIDGVMTQVGWQYHIRAERGALVTRSIGAGFTAPPLVAARPWIASMMDKDPELIQMIDRPDRVQNTGAMIISDHVTVTGGVKYRGSGGIRVAPDGTISRFAGIATDGEEIFDPMYLPGQSASGITIGIPGAGKTVSIIARILDLIFAGGLPTLMDPKELVDYSHLVGFFPIGVTLEHRDVIMRTKMAERERRQKVQAQLGGQARKRVLARRRGEQVPPRTGRPDAFFDTTRHGLLWGAFWEEFHAINDDKFVALIGREQRMQRAIAHFDHLISQDAGLGDFKDGSMRGMFSASGLNVFRTPINRARLAGYKADYDPESMPPLAGLQVRDFGDGSYQVLRAPYLDPDEDAEGGLYDILWGPNGEPLLHVAPIPEPMMEVLEREGLMDLWRLGQGENGVDNLLAGTAPAVRDAPNPQQVAGTVGLAKMEAKDVFLALAGQNPGISRRAAHDHPMWLTHAGWDSAPHPSQISRGLKALRGYAAGEKVGKDMPSQPVLVEGGDDALRVTAAGAQLAADLYAKLAARPPVPAGLAVSEGASFELTEAQAAERAADLANEARLEAAMSGER